MVCSCSVHLCSNRSNPRTNIFKETSDHNYHNSSTYGKFVNLRQNGGLILGFESSFKIIMEAEKILLNLTNNLTNLNVPDLNNVSM